MEALAKAYGLSHGRLSQAEEVRSQVLEQVHVGCGSKLIVIVREAQMTIGVAPVPQLHCNKKTVP